MDGQGTCDDNGNSATSACAESAVSAEQQSFKQLLERRVALLGKRHRVVTRSAYSIYIDFA